MIYTMTFNPAIDYIVRVDDFKLGQVNRTEYEAIYPGGKGINVSIVLNNLGIENIALGYIAGFTGDEIQRKINELGCNTDFIKLKNGMSRINFKLKSNEESEVNGQGPVIEDIELDELYAKLEVLKEGDILVLAGSIPSSLPTDIYEIIMKKLEHKNIKIIVDTTKSLLLNVLKYKPFLIKPNHHELAELFDVDIQTEEELVFYAKKLKDMGAQNIVISRASKGAILITEDNQVIKNSAPKGEVKNSVGAGDSMVAGFIAGYLKNNNLGEAFKMGIATGSASAFSDDLATKEKVYELLNQI